MCLCSYTCIHTFFVCIALACFPWCKRCLELNRLKVKVHISRTECGIMYILHSMSQSKPQLLLPWPHSPAGLLSCSHLSVLLLSLWIELWDAEEIQVCAGAWPWRPACPSVGKRPASAASQERDSWDTTDPWWACGVQRALRALIGQWLISHATVLSHKGLEQP